MDKQEIIADIVLFCDKLGLNWDIKDECCYFCYSILDSQIKGIEADKVASGIIYGICRSRGIYFHYELDVISGMVAYRAYKLLKSRGIKFPDFVPTDYIQIIKKYCSYLKMNEQDITQAIRIFETSNKPDRANVSYRLAAAAVYIAGLPQTQRQVADIFGVTECCIRDGVKEINPNILKEMDQKLKTLRLNNKARKASLLIARAKDRIAKDTELIARLEKSLEKTPPENPAVPDTENV